MSVLMRIFPKSVKNGRNQASKFQENLEVFFCPFLEESNFRNKQSMVQYPRSYQRDKWIIEKEQNKSYAGQLDLYLKNKSSLFYGRCKVVHHALFCRFDRGLLHHF